MIIQADEHVTLITRAVALEAALGKALGVVGDLQIHYSFHSKGSSAHSEQGS